MPASDGRMSWFIRAAGSSGLRGDGARRPAGLLLGRGDAAVPGIFVGGSVARGRDRASSTGCAAIGSSTGCAAAQRGSGAARRRLLGRARLPHRARAAHSEQDAAHRAHPPVAFLSAMEPRRTACCCSTATGPDRVAQLARGRPLRPRPAARPAAARSPTSSARRPSSTTCRPATTTSRSSSRRRAAGRTLSVLVAHLRRRHEAGAVAGLTEEERTERDAARLRRQRLARDPHAADRAVGLPRDADRTCR